MSKNVHTKPRALRIDSQAEAVASSVEVTAQREAPAQDQASAVAGDSSAPKPRTTRHRLLTITQRFATFRTHLPIWSLLVLALLFVGPVAAFEPVFGGGVGAIAAGAGVACGLLIAAASTRWRWDALTTVLSVVVTYFLLGSAAALRTEALYGFLPTGKTLQVMVLGSFRAWKDLLTLTAPVSVYSGPALVPWMCGLVCAVLAGLITARSGRAILGSFPLVLMGIISIFFGLSHHALPVWAVLAWWALLAGWWALAAQYQRITLGQDVLVGRSASGGGEATVARSRSTVYVGTRVMGALAVLAVSVGVALPAAVFLGAGGTRIVGRDLVQPPLDIQAYPSPLSSFRHYTTDLKDETLLTVSDLPENQRVRIAAMDVYDGTTFGMSTKRGDGHTGYIPVESTIPGRAEGNSLVTVTTNGLSGPWVPVLGNPSEITFTDADSAAQKDGLYVDTWANAALTTGPAGTMTYNVRTSFAEPVRDEDLASLSVVPLSEADKNVPEGLATKVSEITQNASTALSAARAIEHYLANNGYYLNENTQFSRPGVRTDRLERMLSSDEQLIGDDQQYTALMALMLHQMGMNARVVMGAYPEGGSQGGPATLHGSDIRAWVEVEFEGGVWAVFDPTPPRDHTPQTQVPKPRSVPRPQVLQPPEPPEAPAELPPTTRDQNADPMEPPAEPFPWGLVAGISGGILLILLPPLMILLFKAERRRRRRRAAAVGALVGSWDEVVDLAADSGLRIDVGHTRQETAWSLASQWELGENPGDPFTLVTGEVRHGDDGSTDSVEVDEAEAGAGRYVIDGWSRFGDDVPAPVVVARYADIASFASNGASRDRARDAWAQVSSLRTQVSKKAGFLARVRHALSLRSLRMRRKLRLSASIARTMDEEKKA
ncbi:Transglutaminase-like superfamily protein [uncultured Actinomyces sp.]|nr:Transglutaminase-like superfamily protein [uncultured Actinomyces sp.]